MNTTSTISGKYLSLPLVAEMFGRSENAIRQMIWRRQLPYRKVAGRIVFLRAEIEKLIEEAPGVRPEQIEKAGS